MEQLRYENSELRAQLGKIPNPPPSCWRTGGVADVLLNETANKKGDQELAFVSTTRRSDDSIWSTEPLDLGGLLDVRDSMPKLRSSPGQLKLRKERLRTWEAKAVSVNQSARGPTSFELTTEELDRDDDVLEIYAVPHEDAGQREARKQDGSAARRFHNARPKPIITLPDRRNVSVHSVATFHSEESDDAAQVPSDDMSPTMCTSSPFSNTRVRVEQRADSLKEDGVCSVLSKSSHDSTLVLLPIWVTDKGRKSSRRPSVHSNMSGSTTMTAHGVLNGHAADHLANFIIPPHSFVSLAWQALTVLAVGFDVFTIPLQVFQPPAWYFVYIADWVTAGIWTADLVLSFFTGFTDVSRGINEMRPAHIRRRYLRTWFTLDFSVNILDWLLLAGDASLQFQPALKHLRALRLLRMVKVAEKSVMPLALAIPDIIKRDTLSAVVSIVLVLCGLCIINHFIACAWYAIGTIKTDESLPRWVDEVFDDELHSIRYRYLTAFHWALTQFTPASMEVFPRNSMERCFNVLIILFGLVTFSSFVGSITNRMNYIRQQKQDRRKHMVAVSRFIGDHKVSAELANSIVGFVRRRTTSRRTRMLEKDIPAFKTVPDYLMMKLHNEVYCATITSHPLFRHLQEQTGKLIQNLCHTAMFEINYTSDEVVFSMGKKCGALYFCMGDAGQFMYALGNDELLTTKVVPGKWLCEPALWVNWEHRGRLTASCDSCRLHGLISSEFQALMKNSHHMRELETYAREFLKMLVRDAGGSHYVSDISGSKASAQKLVTKAWELGDDEEGACRVVRILFGDPDPRSVFNGWKKVWKRNKSPQWRLLTAVTRPFTTRLHRKDSRKLTGDSNSSR